MSKGLKVSYVRITVVASKDVIKDVMSINKVHLCGMGVLAHPVLCVKCGKWFHSRCAGVKTVAPKCSRDVAFRICGGSIGMAVVQEERLCDGVETVREFTYLGGTVSVGGGCETAVTSRAGLWSVKFWNMATCCVERGFLYS